jgi:hypothetical protein
MNSLSHPVRDVSVWIGLKARYQTLKFARHGLAVRSIPTVDYITLPRFMKVGKRRAGA